MHLTRRAVLSRVSLAFSGGALASLLSACGPAVVATPTVAPTAPPPAVPTPTGAAAAPTTAATKATSAPTARGAGSTLRILQI